MRRTKFGTSSMIDNVSNCQTLLESTYVSCTCHFHNNSLNGDLDPLHNSTMIGSWDEK